MQTPLPNVTESSVSSENEDLIQQVVIDAAEFLGLDLASASPESIVNAVDDYVHRLQLGTAPLPEGQDAELFFGCLWGEQLVREFGWQWANVTFHDHKDTQALGVFSPDRSLAIYPFHFIFGCLENKSPTTISLSFNVLRDPSRIPDLPVRGYENVMDNVHHVVPRD
jgi:hypothetical protein